MASIKGDITVMPLTDLLQWIDLAKKTGTVLLNRQETEKKIYLEDGKIIFISSNRNGERLGEYLHQGSYLDAGKIKSALLQSQTMKVHFTQRLIDLGYFTPEALRDIIVKHAQEILMESLDWVEGAFEFVQGDLPSYVIKGTISLNTAELIYEVFQRLEAAKLGFPKP